MADPLDQLITDLSNGNVFGGAPATGGTDSGLTRTNAPGKMPADWENTIQEAAKNYGIEPTLIKAVLQQESGFNSSAIGKAVKGKDGKINYAQGAGQFMPDTAAEQKITDPTDPGQAINGTARYLRQLIDTHGGDIGKALNDYSGGMGAPYVRGVYDKYQKLGGDPQQFAPMVPDKIPASVPALAPGGGTQPPAMDTGKAGLFGDILDGIAPANGEDQGSPQGSAVAAPVVNPPHGTTNPTAPIVGNLPDRPGYTAQPTRPDVVGAGGYGAGWTGSDQTASSMLFGAGPMVKALATAVQGVPGDLANGDIGGAIGRAAKIYPIAHDALIQAQADYKAREPINAAGADILGSTISTVPALGAARKIIGAATEAGGQAFPEIGRVLAPVGGFLAGEGGAAGTGGGLMARSANKIAQVSSKAANAALEGAGAGAINTGTTGGNPISNAVTGAEVGGPVGGTLAAAGSLFSRFAPEVNPEVAQLMTRLQKLGIDVHPNQFVKEGPGHALGPMAGDEAQLAQHTAAVAKTIGATGTKLTPDVMSQAADNTAATLENVAQHTQIPATALIGGPGQTGPLAAIEKQAMTELPTHGTALPYIRQQVSNILNEVGQTGAISGDVYQSLTRYNGAIGRMIRNTDPDIASYGIKLRGALDDALEANAPPGMMDQLKTARAQWKNMLIAEKAVDTTTGIVNPQKYAAAAKKFNTEFAYQPGGDVNTIARSAPFMPSPTAAGSVKPTSGGAVKAAVQAVAKHPITGIMGLGMLAHEASPLAGLAMEHPYLASGFGVPALLATAGRKLYQALGNTQAYKNMLLRNAGATPPGSIGETLLRAPAGISKALVPAAVTGANR